jgi:hypothetical protein
MIAFVSLYHEHKKVDETTPVRIVPSAASRLGRVPIRFEISLHSLTPGDYACEISVLDPRERKVSFWQAPLLLIK